MAPGSPSGPRFLGIVTSRCSAFIALLTTACGGQEDPAGPLYVAIGPPVASVEAPESQSGSLVLLDDGTACVTETYWYRIVCKDPGGESLMFGAQGEGPGEFLDAYRVLRGPHGMIAVMDSDLGRLSMFTEAGEFVSAVSSFPNFPSVFFTGRRKAVEETIVGYTFDLTMESKDVEIELATGRVLWERSFPLEEDVVDCSTRGPGDGQLRGGYAGSGSSLLFVTCYGEYLVWYADRDDPEPAGIVRTTYVERYPTDREVAAEMQVLQSAPWYVSEDEIRSRPKAWYGPRVVDDRQRFWAVWYSEPSSEVPTPMSYIDLFHLTNHGPLYELTLELQDNVLGMDVLGDMLAVLVERDVGGLLPERRVEWYDVSMIG